VTAGGCRRPAGIVDRILGADECPSIAETIASARRHGLLEMLNHGFFDHRYSFPAQLQACDRDAPERLPTRIGRRMEA